MSTENVDVSVGEASDGVRRKRNRHHRTARGQKETPAEEQTEQRVQEAPAPVAKPSSSSSRREGQDQQSPRRAQQQPARHDNGNHDNTNNMSHNGARREPAKTEPNHKGNRPAKRPREEEEDQNDRGADSQPARTFDEEAEGRQGGHGGGSQGGSVAVKALAAGKSMPIVTDYKALKLNPHVVHAIESEFKFEQLTGIQGRCIPAALQGHDLLAEAKTGAGKTLAFLIPIVEIICRAGFRAQNGTASIIIGPTRELCLQIEGVLLKLLKHFNGAIPFLCCIGGQSRNQESYKLASGVMIVVASPGRLLDHLKLTTDWHTKNMLVLAVDEADRVLDNGFEEDMREIVSLLPKNRQTFLFSATQTTRVEQLARISFHKAPIFISMKSKKDKATVDTLDQGYVICPSDQRLMVLYHFVKRNLKKKLIVFFSSRNSVSFHCELFNYIDVPCVAFHGKQKQHQRSATYMQFCNAPSGVLFTTDVASRGLDIPEVDWIVQFDPPDDPVKYIHRVGRTARAGRCGNALLFLLPQEKTFLKYLYEDAKISVNEYEFDVSKLKGTVQDQLEKLVGSNYYLRASARQAYEGYLLAYSSSQLKNVFDIHRLDLAAVAHSFALSEPPPIKIDLSQSAAHMSKKSRREKQDMRHSKDPRRRQMNTKSSEARHSNISGDWN